ncbi:hypothetical protein MVES1_000948 [Malassezia vespertilionis]|uniref:Methyltransferase domain-containing protein n=1 Tax=Malassezia vespertilionis TaxID=2020962 RepID=A0A2N1JFD5_9BASI|nr:uncharacterized protein MVES1_000948 [Malassezia vespertilionis]PKI85240.1 hypothetical protein MVES_000894 [Malassezia vespertilionis]WFD05618.1 hypothetical protein MVES1_000948 [Malassezia vespertilionis]
MLESLSKLGHVGPTLLHRFEKLGPVAVTAVAVFGSVALLAALYRPFREVLVFSYNCFLQPLGKTSNQAERLDRFYEHQAGVYDATRTGLLRGRKTMLKLCAAEMRKVRATHPQKKLVWADIGGGTGWNIEVMSQYMPLAEFDQIYLIDLCEPLLEIARKRFARMGLTNVQVLCQNAKEFTLPGLAPGQKVDLFTCSYSISMMPPFYAVLDRINALLDSVTGVFGVADFYVSSAESTSDQSTLVGGSVRRQCHWLNGWFWRNWFSLDHIELHPARRDYLEHKFGTIKCFNGRNNFIVPYLVRIPYYIWLGVSRERDTSKSVQAFEVEAGNKVVVLPSFPDVARTRFQMEPGQKDAQTPQKDFAVQWPRSSFHYQDKQWRLPFVDDRFSDMFRTWIYGFTWEDPKVDIEFLDMGPQDSILCITSAGDNALHYACTARPHRIHAVDMNPCQGHLLELKLACIASLDYDTFWNMFGHGKIDNFPDLLDGVISPYLSSHAYQFWRMNNSSFDRAFYFRGYSGHALRLAKIAFRLMGVRKDVDRMCTTDTLEEQKKMWDTKVRKTIINETLIRLFLSNPAFLWNALGVPVNQINIFKEEGSVQQFAIDTLDPIPSRALLSNDNYHYRLCLMGNYTKESCPLYLKKKAFEQLKADNSAALDSFRLHTDSIVNVLRGLQDHSLTRAILMDHMDWFDPIPPSRPLPSLEHARDDNEKSISDLDREVVELARVISPGGAVFWRSAAKHPWYAQRFEAGGFRVTPLQIRGTDRAIDNVNMYASFYKAERVQ